MKTLGIIGGMGPMATVYFTKLLVQLNDVETDAGHIPTITYNIPQIPDRTAYILGESKESPLPWLIDAGKRMIAQGAELLCMPCVTAHHFEQELRESFSVPFLSMLETTADEFFANGISHVGVMATDGTMRTMIFHRAFAEHGITLVEPSPEAQRGVMEIIYQNVKAGKPIDMDKFHAIYKELTEHGAQQVLLGCTELSLIKQEYTCTKDCVDAMEILARHAIRICKEEDR